MKNILNEICFNLQFRKDTKTDRPNSPTYYRWKAQFVVTAPADEEKKLEGLLKIFKCGRIHIIKNQARFSIQNISELENTVVPYFTTNPPQKKLKDFELWAKAIRIISKNKGKFLSDWEKEDINNLVSIQKAIVKFKDKPRTSKWLYLAKEKS